MSVNYSDDSIKAVSYDAIKIGLASPQKIKEWSFGEVQEPETINYRTLKPEKKGLFSEAIFGPVKDYECSCGKFKKNGIKTTKDHVVKCDNCGVEITKSSVRRERMGHIELAAPVSHIWYFKGIPSRMGLILDISPRNLEKVLYFAAYIVLDKGETDLQVKQILSETEYNEACDKYGSKAFRVGMGAEAIKELLEAIDLEKEAEEMKEELLTATGQKRAKLVKHLSVVEDFRKSGNRPEWMILVNLPVIPPDLRPMVQLDGGRFATSDMNDLYRRIINRNLRLRKLIGAKAPELVIRNEKRMLQEAVDALIDNGRRGRPVTGPGNRPLKSLSDLLKGKQGRFRQNLLGKRVDYSGRSVIVVGPELKIYQCGLPKEMALELFKPFVVKELLANGQAHNPKAAKKMVDRAQAEVWDILERVIREHPVMLNRAPTLHRLGIQAFEPILVEGKAIKLHPLVCTAFNADFDGDQMAVHLPLSAEAQAEARFLMLSPNNLLKPSDGGPVAVPSQDMVLGIYYLTLRKKGEIGEGKIFKSMNEAYLAYENKVITLHTTIKVRRTMKLENGKEIERIVETTLGTLIFNEVLPQDLGIRKRDPEKPEDLLLLEIDDGKPVGKKMLKKILEKCISVHGATKTAETLDAVKALGYKFSTRAAMTVSVSDMTVPASKKEILAAAQEQVDKIAKLHRRGLTTEEERYKAVIETWKKADDDITKALLGGLDQFNNIHMMADSGARGSDKQIKQLAGMRGLMADTSGRTIELPIKSNFREGLDVLEYFVSAHGARKGLSDTALRTADSGYLTRRLVDVSQDVIIRETECMREDDTEIPGMWVKAFMDKQEVIESLRDRIIGRFSCETILDDNGEVIVKANHMITPKRADRILAKAEFLEPDPRPDHEGDMWVKPSAKVKIRTALTCRSRLGVCAKCYGANMATGEPVQVGEAVGIIAAQSIGEPGTQLTMRTFHTGGVAGGDITQGLPRVEELFETRKPKGLAIIAEFGGNVEIRDTKKKREVVVTNPETGDAKAYLIPYGSRIKVLDGQVIEAGDELTEGSVYPHDILKIKGINAVQDYMLREVQRVYRLQGVEINDKHIEVIVRQTMKKVRVDEPGDSELLPGTNVDLFEFEDINKALVAEGKRPAEGKQIMLGITKAALATNSFLSAASFQEPTRVLTDASIKGKIDPLIGLKENVILGKLIPAGTGMKQYRNIALDTDQDTFEDEYADMEYDENGYSNYGDGYSDFGSDEEVSEDSEELEDEFYDEPGNDEQ